MRIGSVGAMTRGRILAALVGSAGLTRAQLEDRGITKSSAALVVALQSLLKRERITIANPGEATPRYRLP